ncbi:phage tail length tape measure family protein [Sphingobium yanoikuyae]|uniref:phage tail length tape measure family protein n=1 Tax=Sphingobium yanoikuyae TaxID=13690 RepID=UPI0026F1F1E3|nr:phage tail length tape measure family protein [Sphingobium yanoikuyae]
MDVAALSMNVDSSKVVQAANDLERFSKASDRAAASAAKVNFGNQSGSIAKLVASVQSIDSKMSSLISTVEKLANAERAATAANDNMTAGMGKTSAAVAVADSHVIAYTQHLAKLAQTQRDANAHVLAWQNHVSSGGLATQQADAHVVAYQKHLASISSAATQASSGVERLTRTATASAGALQANTGNIAAQFQDIGVTAAMGMNPLIIGLQQGTQLSAVFAQSGGSMAKVLTAAFMQIASAQALMTIGLVAGIAALIQMVDWSNLAQKALNGLADILPQVATAIAYMGAVLALAFAPQILSAILTTISYIGVGLVNAVVAATQAMIAFSIANPFAAFVIAVGLAVAAIWAFNDDLTKILGFNVLTVVKKAANYIIGSFVGAFHDIQFVWNNFPAIIGAAAIGATNAVIRSINWLLEKGTAGINSLIALANKGLDKLGIAPISSVSAPQLAQMANAAAQGLTAAVGARNSQLQKDLSTDYIGAIGGAISDATKWAQDKLRGLAGSIGAEAAKKAKESTASDAAKKAAEKAIWSPDVPIVANPVWDLTANDLPKVDAIQPVETAVTRLYQGMLAAREVTRGFLSEWINGIREGGNIFKTFADSVVNSLNRIIDKLLDKTLNSFLDSMFSGGGGLFGSLMSSLGLGSSSSGSGIVVNQNAISGAFKNALGGVYGSAQRFANGGAFTNSIVNTPTLFRFANGAALGEMGEAGPEAIMPLKRGANGALGVQAHGGGGRKIELNYNNYNNFEGAIGVDSIVAMNRQASEAAYNQVKRDLQSLLQQLDTDGAFAS